MRPYSLFRRLLPISIQTSCNHGNQSNLKSLISRNMSADLYDEMMSAHLIRGYVPKSVASKINTLPLYPQFQPDLDDYAMMHARCAFK